MPHHASWNFHPKLFTGVIMKRKSYFDRNSGRCAARPSGGGGRRSGYVTAELGARGHEPWPRSDGWSPHTELELKTTIALAAGDIIDREGGDCNAMQCCSQESPPPPLLRCVHPWPVWPSGHWILAPACGCPAPVSPVTFRSVHWSTGGGDTGAE